MDLDWASYHRRFQVADAAVQEACRTARGRAQQARWRKAARQLDWAQLQVQNAQQAPGPTTAARAREYALRHLAKAEEILGIEEGKEMGRAEDCGCRRGYYLCSVARQLWDETSTAYRRAVSLLPSPGAWAEFERARAAYDAHMAAADEAQQREREP